MATLSLDVHVPDPIVTRLAFTVVRGRIVAMHSVTEPARLQQLALTRLQA
ncbi:MAG TPA: hypothetical protein VGL99_27470 [Chloroflexota bacterium]